MANNRPGDTKNRTNQLASSGSGRNQTSNASDINKGNSNRHQSLGPNDTTNTDIPTVRKSVRHKVARFVRRFTQKNLLLPSQKQTTTGNKEEKHDLLPLLFYGGGICGLSVALFYAWYVSQSLSTKTFVTLSVLMLVLMAIFVQEFILDDLEDESEAMDTGMFMGYLHLYSIYTFFIIIVLSWRLFCDLKVYLLCFCVVFVYFHSSLSIA